MTDPTNRKPRRSIHVRRTISLGTTIATATIATATIATGALGTGVMASSIHSGLGSLDRNSLQMAQTGPAGVTLVAGGEGGEGGEGEGATPLDPGVALLRDLGILEAHVLAGFALYQAGDIAAARPHFDRPVTETYDAIAAPLAASGRGQLRDQLVDLARAAEAEMPADQMAVLLAAVRTNINDARGDLTLSQQVTALSTLTRLAADEYGVAATGQPGQKRYAYQTSWGLLEGVKAQAATLSQSADAALAKAAGRIVTYLSATDPAFGGIQDQDVMKTGASLIYGAAARIELAALGVK